MNILCRLSIGLPTWHNGLLYTRARDNASWILCTYVYTPMCALPCTYERHTYVARRAYARKLLLCVCSPTAKWLIIAYSPNQWRNVPGQTQPWRRRKGEGETTDGVANAGCDGDGFEGSGRTPARHDEGHVPVLLRNANSFVIILIYAPVSRRATQRRRRPTGGRGDGSGDGGAAAVTGGGGFVYTLLAFAPEISFPLPSCRL